MIIRQFGSDIITRHFTEIIFPPFYSSSFSRHFTKIIFPPFYSSSFSRHSDYNYAPFLTQTRLSFPSNKLSITSSKLPHRYYQNNNEKILAWSITISYYMATSFSRCYSSWIKDQRVVSAPGEISLKVKSYAIHILAYNVRAVLLSFERVTPNFSPLKKIKASS